MHVVNHRSKSIETVGAAQPDLFVRSSAGIPLLLMEVKPTNAKFMHDRYFTVLLRQHRQPRCIAAGDA